MPPILNIRYLLLQKNNLYIILCKNDKFRYGFLKEVHDSLKILIVIYRITYLLCNS